ncbi:acyltransferase [Rhizobium herbae]|uniref:Acyltransferase n=1 Tax=Rhizobium herbae TaxID=508661 RepID=A0ABS7HBJ2_9HYPH|nr:acyltransferase [Rhizobium herbae]MBW9063779.1 acyltransferase [Rhizobium herbae]
MKTIYGIQYLRAFAALAVVLFHAAEKTGHHFAIGAAGVDVFFVISGFIMWVISDRRALTPAGFLYERVRRIAPIYWLATMVMVAGGILGLFPNLVLTTQHIAASLLFVPVRSPSTGEIWPVLVQGWTLNFEMFFYVIFALSLFLERRWRLTVVAAVFAALVLSGLVVRVQNPIFVTYTRPIMLEFIAGMFIGQAWLKGRVLGPHAGMFLMVMAIGGFLALQVFGLSFNEFNCGPLAVALVAGALFLEAAGWVGRWRVFTFFGDASYSIYIWHTFAISLIAKLGGSVGLDPVITFVVAVVGGTASGSCAYLLLERPLAKLFKSPKPKSWPHQVPAEET